MDSLLNFVMLTFYWLLTLLSIILSFRFYSCLLSAFLFSRYILSATLLLFSRMFWMQVSATVWNFVTSSFILRVFKLGDWTAGTWGSLYLRVEIAMDCFWEIFLDSLSRILMLSGLARSEVIFFCRYVAFFASFSI